MGRSGILLDGGGGHGPWGTIGMRWRGAMLLSTFRFLFVDPQFAEGLPPPSRCPCRAHKKKPRTFAQGLFIPRPTGSISI